MQGFMNVKYIKRSDVSPEHTACPKLQDTVKTEAACTSETSVPTYQTTARCLNQQHCTMLHRNPSTDAGN